MAFVAVIGVVVVVVSLDDGGSPLGTRSVAAILVWWGILLGVAFSVAPRAPLRPAAVVGAGLLVAYGVLAALSTGWSPSAERAFLEADRALLYAGVLLLPVLFARPGEGGRWADGLALGIAVVGVLALGQRLFPDLLPGDDIAEVLPNAATRLTYPLGYWNGLGVFLGLGVPLLLRAAVLARLWLWRAAAVAPVPALAGAIYLTSSRGGVAVAVLSALLFAVLSGFRAILALAFAGAGSAVAVALLSAHGELVDGPFGTAAAESAGREAALTIALCCLATGLLYALASVRAPLRLRLNRWVWALPAIVAIATVTAANPSERVREFKAPPPANDAPGAEAVGAHLAGGGGSGRWQFWSTALDEFKEHPLAGGGAGSFEPYWAQHGSLDWFVRNAHSLWFETLAELGLLGLLLVGGAFAVALASGVARLRGRPDAERATAAALVAVVAGFALGAALDWVWQLPVVAIAAMLAAGLLLGPATDRERAAAPEPEQEPEPARRRLGVRALVALGAWLIICAQAIPFLASQELGASQREVRRGDLHAALERARSAEAIQPWAASPRLQLALVHERAGDVERARRDIDDAIERDDEDWRLRLVAARLAAKAGDIEGARLALARARDLNPRSQLLRNP
jgi:hypothetical protein